MKQALSILDATPKNIWNYQQNHPELVIKDLKEYGYGDDVQTLVRQSMLCRGINKWLKVRRDLIAYKKLIKHDIKTLTIELSILKSDMTNKYCTINHVINNEKTQEQLYEYFKARTKYEVAKEILKEKSKTRHDLKKLCMTERWQIWQGRKLNEMNSIKASDK